MIRIKRTFNLILTLAFWLVAAQMATAQEAAVYDLVTEEPTKHKHDLRHQQCQSLGGVPLLTCLRPQEVYPLDG